MMPRKTVWLVLSCLLAVSAILSSCSNATSTSTATTATTSVVTTSSTTTQATTTQVTTSVTSTTSTTVTTTSTPVTSQTGTPQYGGSLTVYTNWGNSSPTGFDDLTSGLPQATVWDNPFTEMLVRGDINTYGPRGTNAFAFNIYENVPEQFLGGELATAWTINTTGNTSTPYTMTFTLRQGVMFTGNTKIGMAPRQFTSADVVYSINRTKATPGPASFLNFVNNVAAPSTFTVVFTLNSYAANWDFLFGGGMNMGAIQPQEMAAANASGDDWRNTVGTGPFILTSYVVGSEATYVRNPNYWGQVSINGKAYQMPFIQTLYYPIIPDASTQIAAVRVGKIDWDPYVPYSYQQNLATSAPTMTQTKYLAGKISLYKINRLNSKTLSNKTVRQALMIGTDLQTISNLLYNGGPIVTWPLGPQMPGYTPLNQLPAADQQLYNYNPTLAKQMLASAGYPSGFTVSIYTDALGVDPDLANALQTMWAQIGVTLTIKTLDSTSMTTATNNLTYPDMISSNGYTVVNPLTTLNLMDGTRIGATYLTTEPFQAQFVAMETDTNPVDRTAKIQALSIAFLDDVAVIPFAQPYILNCYWPWVQNYYGELEAGYYNEMPMIKQIWINQSLKQ
ncbi:MAG: ABC transporter substrate-binding protein [Dehalococcoidales bacterium]